MGFGLEAGAYFQAVEACAFLLLRFHLRGGAGAGVAPLEVGNDEYIRHGISFLMELLAGLLKHLVAIGATRETIAEEVLHSVPIARVCQVDGMCADGIGNQETGAVLLACELKQLHEQGGGNLNGSSLHGATGIDRDDDRSFDETWKGLGGVFGFLHLKLINNETA